MEIADYEPISRSELSEAPEWYHRDRESSHEPVRNIILSMQNNLTFGHNMHAEVRDVELTDDTALTIRLQSLRGIPRMAFLVWSEIFDYGRLAWRVLEQDLVEIKVKFESSPTSPTLCRLLFLGD